MSDIELVIKIPKELFNLIQDKLDFNGDLKQKDIKTLMLAIDNGTPLPKGHGRLIDANRFDVFSYQYTSDDFDKGVMWFAEQIDNAPTIIKADKAKK